ncbi:MAG: hypothetical protein AAGG01_01105, partial [Planctomycetota bacterium]
MMIQRTLRSLGACVPRSLPSTALLLTPALFPATSHARPAQDTPAPTMGQAGMLRYPDVSETSIVFVYANDLWLVPREGGIALPLASPPGAERNPRFSADGKTVAFSGNYDGDSDLYTLSVEGGVPFRVTHHPGGDTFSDWTADGRLIFSTSAFSGQRRAPKMFTVPQTGGLPEQVPVPYGLNGTIHADGKWLAYTPNARDGRNWKRYVGGTASDVWLFHLEDRTSRRVTDWEGTDSFPMWNGDDLYYVSDRGPAHRLNVWKFDIESGEHTQVTRFTDFDVKWPAIGPGTDGGGEIVFQNNYGLFLTDLATGTTRQVDVKIPGAAETVRARAVDVASSISSSAISSTGKRAVVEARGDIWTLPAEKGRARNLTATSGVAERDPSWSPDGRWVAYFSDESGEYELCVTQSDGRGETKQLTHDTEGFKYDPTWSPDSKKIAYSDRSGTIFLHDLEAETTTRVDQHDSAEWGVRVNWSHDSRWLAYSKFADEAMRSVVMLYDTDAGEAHQVTGTMFSSDSPTFDRKGDFLYFASVRNFSGSEGSMIDSNYVYQNAEVLLAVPLRSDVEYPWTPESDEEDWDDEESEEGEDEMSEDSSDESNEEEESDEPAAKDDGISGSYTGTLSVPTQGESEVSLSLSLDGTAVTGSISSVFGSASMKGSLDGEKIEGSITPDDGDDMPFSGTLGGGNLKITLSTEAGDATITASRSGGGSDGDEDESDDSDKEAAETVEIELEGFEHRAMQLPLAPGAFGNLAVNADGHLMYSRRGAG